MNDSEYLTVIEAPKTKVIKYLLSAFVFASIALVFLRSHSACKPIDIAPTAEVTLRQGNVIELSFSGDEGELISANSSIALRRFGSKNIMFGVTIGDATVCENRRACLRVRLESSSMSIMSEITLGTKIRLYRAGSHRFQVNLSNSICRGARMLELSNASEPER